MEVLWRGGVHRGVAARLLRDLRRYQSIELNAWQFQCLLTSWVRYKFGKSGECEEWYSGQRIDLASVNTDPLFWPFRKGSMRDGLVFEIPGTVCALISSPLVL